MLNPNEEQKPNVHAVINTENVLTYIRRLGITDEELTSENFNENVIASKVLANESLTQDYAKTVKTSQDTFLTGKLKKIMSEISGLTEEEVKEDTDFRKIISKGFDKVKSTGNQDVDKIAIEYRTKELGYQNQLELLQAQLETEKAKTTTELKNYKVSMKVDSFINTANLTQTAKANQKEITDMAILSINRDYDIREKDGLLVIYTKAGQPVFKAGSSNPTLLEDMLETHLDKFGFIKKQEEVKTLNTPNTPAFSKPQTNASIGYSRKEYHKGNR